MPWRDAERKGRENHSALRPTSLESRAGVIREMHTNQADAGVVFHDGRAPTAKERECFAGWFNPHQSPANPITQGAQSVWRVRSEDDGRMCREHPIKVPARLLTGEKDWSDYTLGAQVRQMGTRSVPWYDARIPDQIPERVAVSPSGRAPVLPVLLGGTEPGGPDRRFPVGGKQAFNLGDAHPRQTAEDVDEVVLRIDPSPRRQLIRIE